MTTATKPETPPAADKTQPIVHTPGPWHAHKEFSNLWRIEKYRDMGVTPLSVANVTLTQCEVGVQCDDANREIEANARLIAAAPDLVAACKAALEDSEMIPGRVYYGPGLELTGATIDLLKAAVSKATGVVV